MERSRLIVNFDSSCDKLLSTENVVARGETFDILFRDVTLSGTVRVAFWDYETLLWRSEGSASQRDGGSVLEGLIADTKELADVFRGGSGFFAARLTVGEQVGGDEWRDYGVAYVRLYSGTDPSENPPPARPDIYPTEEELNAWLDDAKQVQSSICDCSKAAAASAEAAGASANTAAQYANKAVDAAQVAEEDAKRASASAKAASVSAEQAQAAAETVGDFSDHLEDHANPHRVTAAQVGALTETTANGLYPRFRNEDATTTVGNNHGRNVMASQNGEDGGFYVTGVAGNPPSRKQWLTEYQRNRVRVYTETSGESKDYYWDDSPSGDAEKAILRWCDLFAQAVTTVWRGIMRMCNPRIAANADDASKDIALVPNANGQGLQLQFPGGATAMIRAKTGTLATVAEVNEKDASTLAEAKAYADGKVVDVYRFKGSVATEAALPKTGNVTGDVWNVSEDGMNYAWTGEEWDALGASVDLSAYSTTAQADARYLKLSGGTVTGNVTFNGADNYMTSLRFGGSAEAAGLKTRGICGWNVLNQKNGLFLNYDGRDVPTEEYFSAGEKRGVYICGGIDKTNQTCLVLRKMDGDYFYAPKATTYTKAEVDTKISNALGDIQSALEAI